MERPAVTASERPVSREKALRGFLAEAFDSAALRRWVHDELGESAHHELPGPVTDHAELVFQTVLLIRRRHRFDAALFQSLVDWHPTREAEIRALAARFEDRPDTGGTAAPGPKRPRSLNSPIALLLDRSRQWDRLILTCTTSKQPVAFLVHGDVGQDVGLFTRRVQRQLNKHLDRTHQVCRLAFRSDNTTPRRASDWIDRLYDALPYGGDTAAEALAFATSGEVPVVLVVGDRTPLTGLDDEQTRALTGFLGAELPDLVRGLPEGSAAVHVIVPIEHRGHASGRKDPLVRAVYLTLRSPARPGIAFERLVELTFPEWVEVEEFLARELGSIDTDLMDECHEAYDAITAASPTPSFADLVDTLQTLLDADLAP